MSPCVLMDGCSYASWTLSDFCYAFWLWAKLFLKLDQPPKSAFSVCFKHVIYRRMAMLGEEGEALGNLCARSVPEGFAVWCCGGQGAARGMPCSSYNNRSWSERDWLWNFFLKAVCVLSFTFTAPLLVWIVILFLYPSKTAFQQLSILNSPHHISFCSDTMGSYLFLSERVENIDCPLSFNSKYFT